MLFSLREAGERIRAGLLSSHDLVEAAIQAAQACNPALNAFRIIHRDRALREARLADDPSKAGKFLGSLHGIPLAVKDNIDEAGVVCSAGCLAYRDRVPGRDAAVVSALRAGGAIIVGRTNMHELANGVTCEKGPFGPVHNPWKSGFFPGGSSGGSAAACAAGCVSAALGTDTGGSVRIPASLCGVVGFKPTQGLLPTGGVVPLSTTLDHVGILARQTSDLSLVLSALSPGAGACGDSAGSTWRIGVLDGFGAEADSAVGIAFAEALRTLEGIGCRLRPQLVPGLSRGIRLLVAIYQPEVAAAHSDILRLHPDEISEEIRIDLEHGRNLDPARHDRALADRAVLEAAVVGAMDGLDFLVSPTTPHPAKPMGSPNPHTYLTFTCPFNLTGQPALSLPMGLVEGLPVGLQIVGRRGEDERVLFLAAALEPRLGFSLSAVTRV